MTESMRLFAIAGEPPEIWIEGELLSPYLAEDDSLSEERPAS